MIRTAWPHDLPALRALFARANDAPYDLAAVAEEKCFGRGYTGVPVARVYDRDGHIAGASVTCGRYLRILIVDREDRGNGIGTALFEDAEAREVNVIAAEPGNYFLPGVLMTDDNARAFFHRRGYIETRWTYNLDAPLDYVYASDAVRRPAHEEADRVLDFIGREFGHIWRFEAAKAFERDEPSMFIAETEDGDVAGFAAHDLNNRGLGFFGPTGVAETLRGRGIGCALLQASLADLRRLGYRKAVIPWTDALDFYRKCSGAEPAHRFVAFAKPRS